MCSPTFLPFLGPNPLYQFNILSIDIKKVKQKYFTMCYKTKEKKIDEIELKTSDLKYFKESTNGKGILIFFDDKTKDILVYNL